MNYSVADAIASVGGDAASLETGDISAILPYEIAPGAKAVMRKEKRAAEEVDCSNSMRNYCEKVTSRIG